MLKVDDTVPVTRGDVPRWPANNKIFWSIVKSHNDMIDDCKATAKLLNGSQSITLVMICAAIRKAIPLKYRLDTKRAKGIADHPTYVKEYLQAVGGGTPMSDKGKRLGGPIKLFAVDLDVSVKTVTDGLVEAFKSEV